MNYQLKGSLASDFSSVHLPVKSELLWLMYHISGTYVVTITYIWQ